MSLSYLIKKAAQGPNVAGKIVFKLIQTLRGHVVPVTQWHNHRSSFYIKSCKSFNLETYETIKKLTYGVPTREWAAAVLELKNFPRPKSPSLTTRSLVTKTLAGLISFSNKLRTQLTSNWCVNAIKRKNLTSVADTFRMNVLHCTRNLSEKVPNGPLS